MDRCTRPTISVSWTSRAREVSLGASPIRSSELSSVATTRALTEPRSDYSRHACQRAKQHLSRRRSATPSRLSLRRHRRDATDEEHRRRSPSSELVSLVGHGRLVQRLSLASCAPTPKRSKNPLSKVRSRVALELAPSSTETAASASRCILVKL